MHKRERPVLKIFGKEEDRICQRIRQIRTELTLTQPDVASRIGVTREKLASIEDGRAPVKIEFGLRFCRQLMVSERWLATGEGAVTQYLSVEKKVSLLRVSLSSLYSEVFFKFLAPVYEARLAQRQRVASFLVEEGDDISFEEIIFKRMFALWKAKLAPGEAAAFFSRLNRTASEFFASLPADPLPNSDAPVAKERREILVDVVDELLRAHEIKPKSAP